jgi:hypothetical protein
MAGHGHSHGGVPCGGHSGDTGNPHGEEDASGEEKTCANCGATDARKTCSRCLAARCE